MRILLSRGGPDSSNPAAYPPFFTWSLSPPETPRRGSGSWLAELFVWLRRHIGFEQNENCVVFPSGPETNQTKSKHLQARFEGTD